MPCQRWRYRVILTIAGLFIVLGIASLAHRWIVAVEKVSVRSEEQLFLSETIQVRIVNACGYPGAARRMMEYLRHLGVDVVEIGTAPYVLPHSVVWDHVGAPRYAQYIARIAKVPDSLVLSRKDSSLYVHCSLVLGLDILRTDPFTRR
ncbi:MAG: LytR C-terminal domain-containing protein [Candidatus Kapabacteria bacterium]|nr:LytR C-terminal domain-containing protein [Candidatus Kapabacteria bacterium]MCS7170173.1 LytR C-terminal domain-containing protein [Candidatus Kapabacteria bacterium]MDW7997026.1 LytR C-terminal domain-containing protein [Bacteroidota bacterium]MDW8225852.1 LytR C-terminal domain-containing protein [Bacteroidota bacterium]